MRKSKRRASPAQRFALLLFNERVRQDNLKTLISVKYSLIQVLHQNLLFIMAVFSLFAICSVSPRCHETCTLWNRTRASTGTVCFPCACMVNWQFKFHIRNHSCTNKRHYRYWTAKSMGAKCEFHHKFVLSRLLWLRETANPFDSNCLRSSSVERNFSMRSLFFLLLLSDTSRRHSSDLRLCRSSLSLHSVETLTGSLGVVFSTLVRTIYARAAPSTYMVWSFLRSISFCVSFFCDF